MGDFLLLAFIFLCAGVVAVPIATRFGLGSVLGYLLAGIAISPILATLHVDVVAIQHFAEFGVVMMLFLVGLELEPKLLWRMRSKLLGLGGLQVGVTTLVVMGVAMALGLSWNVSLAIGFVFSLSSTAIVLQTLNEKGLMKSDGGQSAFSVLLFQDIAVIPILAFLPLLAMPELVDATQAALEQHVGAAGHADGHNGEEDHGTGLNLISGLPAWAQALSTIGAVAIVILVGSVLTRPLFRFIAWARLRELFTATALLVVIGISILMMSVGLSPALGAFLAGVVLANSEYRHELESDIEPFKGLLLGLFFITVGASVDFALLGDNLAPIVGLTLGLMALKFLILLALGVFFRIRGGDRWLFALSLAQAGEFGFVLLSFTVQNNVIPKPLADQLLLVVALSMLLTPLLFIAYDTLIAPRLKASNDREPDDISPEGNIIIAGHGRFGGIVNRMLRSTGFETTVLDFSSEQLEMLRAFNFKVFFGDATRPDLLHAAGVENARLIVICIDDRDQITELAHHIRQKHPDVHVIARAVDRPHVYELYAVGVRDIIRETFDSGVRAGRTAFEALGIHPFEAERLARQFAANDRHSMAMLAEVYKPGVALQNNPEYVRRSLELREEHEAELQGEGRPFNARSDRGWSPPTLKDVDAVKEKDEE